MASSSTSGGFQDGHRGLPVTVQHGPSLSGHRLLVGLQQRLLSGIRSVTSRTCCEANLQQLWRQMFCSCRSDTLRPIAHDPSSPSKLLIPESRTRNLETIVHVLFCPSFWYQTNLVPECMTDVQSVPCALDTSLKLSNSGARIT